MKIFGFKSALAMLTFSVIALVSFQSPSQAQVNKKLLSDVIKSCHRDMNVEYFEKMGMKEFYLGYFNNNPTRFRRDCVKYRYRHMALINRLPWLPYSGDTIPGYSGSVALNEILLSNIYWNSRTDYANRVLSCLVDQDPNSSYCSFMWDRSNKYDPQDMVPYVCPKCTVAYNDSSSLEMRKGILQWFLLLDKPKRRELASAFGSSLYQEVENEGWQALQAYDDALKKIEEDDKEQRRRNLLGQ
jgi:hypothetical protein